RVGVGGGADAARLDQVTLFVPSQDATGQVVEIPWTSRKVLDPQGEAILGMVDEGAGPWLPAPAPLPAQALRFGDLLAGIPVSDRVADDETVTPLPVLGADLAGPVPERTGGPEEGIEEQIHGHHPHDLPLASDGHQEPDTQRVGTAFVEARDRAPARLP